MRIRRLTVGDGRIDLEVHPRVTVVRGLDAEGRSLVIDGLQGFFAGNPDAARGVIEIDGAEFDIEPDVLDLLDLPTDLPDIVIRAADLKRVVHPADGKDVTTFGRGAELEQELDQLDGRLAALTARRTELADEIEPAELRERLEAATAAIDTDAEALAESVDDADFTGDEWAAADVARPSGNPDERIAELELEITALKGRLADLDAEYEARRAGDAGDAGDAGGAGGPTAPGLDVGRGIDTIPVAAAFEAFQWVRSWDSEPVDNALVLADRIAAHRRESTVTRSADVPEWLRAQARQQLDEARADVEKAERHVRPQQLDPDDAAALERAHADVDEAEERAHRKLSGPIAARRLTAARAAEEEILQKLNLPSFAAYLLLRASAGNVDPDGERHLTAARAALADAEAMWAEVNGSGEGVDADSHRDEERELRAEAVTVLGPEAAIIVSEVSLERLESVLREQHTPAPDWKPAAAALVEALAAQDVYVPAWSFDDPTDYEALENLAAAWLREATVDGAPTVGATADFSVADDDTFHELERTRATLLSELDRLVDEQGELRRLAVTHGSNLVADTDPFATDEAHGGLEFGVARVETFETFETFEAETGTEPESAFVSEPVTEPGRRLSAKERLQQLRQQTEAQFDVIAAEVSDLAVRFGEALATETEVDPETETEIEVDAATETEIETEWAAGDVEAVETVEAVEDVNTAVSSPAIEELAALDAEAAEVAAEAARLAAERDELISQADDRPANPAEAVAAYLSDRFASLCDVGEAGTLPVLFDGVGDDPEITDAVLGYLADEHPPMQVLLLSDEPAVDHWARQLGIEDAAVIDVPAEDDHETGEFADGDPADPDSAGDWS